MARESVALPDRSIGRCRDLGIGQIHLGDDNSSLLRRYISFVNIIFCVQRLPLAFRSLKLTLACGQGSLGAREIRFSRVNNPAELALLERWPFPIAGELPPSSQIGTADDATQSKRASSSGEAEAMPALAALMAASA